MSRRNGTWSPQQSHLRRGRRPVFRYVHSSGQSSTSLQNSTGFFFLSFFFQLRLSADNSLSYFECLGLFLLFQSGIEQQTTFRILYTNDTVGSPSGDGHRPNHPLAQVDLHLRPLRRVNLRNQSKSIRITTDMIIIPSFGRAWGGGLTWFGSFHGQHVFTRISLTIWNIGRPCMPRRKALGPPLCSFPVWLLSLIQHLIWWQAETLATVEIGRLGGSPSDADESLLHSINKSSIM